MLDLGRTDSVLEAALNDSPSDMPGHEVERRDVHCVLMDMFGRQKEYEWILEMTEKASKDRPQDDFERVFWEDLLYIHQH